MVFPVETWEIYYDDGTTFSDVDGSPLDAPSFGVIAVVTPDETVGRMVMHKWDWYYQVDGQWWGSDIYGVLDRLTHNLEVTALKQGRNVNNTAYRRIIGEATTNPRFPKKSAKDYMESPRPAEGEG